VRGLAALWRVPAPAESTDVCAWARQHELGCHLRPVSLERLFGFDLPAVLELELPGAGRAHALLRGLSAHDATIEIGGRAGRVGRQQLGSLWSGRHVLLWRAPAGIARGLGPGAQGPDVRWLRQRLSPGEGGSGERGAAGASVFDAELRARVMDFQRRRGIDVDGLVGPETLIHLARGEEGTPAPSLSRAGTPRAVESPSASVAMGSP
jgi:general secretion pathway protein A